MDINYITKDLQETKKEYYRLVSQLQNQEVLANSLFLYNTIVALRSKITYITAKLESIK